MALESRLGASCGVRLAHLPGPLPALVLRLWRAATKQATNDRRNRRQRRCSPLTRRLTRRYDSSSSSTRTPQLFDRGKKFRPRVSATPEPPKRLTPTTPRHDTPRTMRFISILASASVKSRPACPARTKVVCPLISAPEMAPINLDAHGADYFQSINDEYREKTVVPAFYEAPATRRSIRLRRAPRSRSTRPWPRARATAGRGARSGPTSTR